MTESGDVSNIFKGNFKAVLTVLIVSSLIIVGLIGYVSSLATYIAPSEEFPLYIQNAFTADQNGNPKETFRRGEIVLVNVTIEMAMEYHNAKYGYFVTPTSFLLLIRFNYGYRLVYLGFIVAELSPGESRSFGIGFRIPEDAVLGDYTVKIMVWSNWLDKGGVSLALNSGMEITFRVEG